MLWMKGEGWQASFVKSLRATQGATCFVLRGNLQVLGRVGSTHTPESASISQGWGPAESPLPPTHTNTMPCDTRAVRPQNNAFTTKRW